MRILFVPGIKTPKSYLSGWKSDFEKNFPNVEKVFLDDIFYWHIQHQKLDTIIQQGVDILADGRPTLLIAHSFGGILAKAIITQSKNQSKQVNIISLITMASPHTLNYMGVKKAKHHIHAPVFLPLSFDFPCFSYGGYCDPIVPFFLTKMNHEPHQNFWCEHLAFLFSKRIRQKVLQEIFTLTSHTSLDTEEET